MLSKYFCGVHMYAPCDTKFSNAKMCKNNRIKFKKCTDKCVSQNDIHNFLLFAAADKLLAIIDGKWKIIMVPLI